MLRSVKLTLFGRSSMSCASPLISMLSTSSCTSNTILELEEISESGDLLPVLTDGEFCLNFTLPCSGTCVTDSSR